MVDISSHILMNLDDGPKSLEQSMIMAKSYESQSIRDVICTPVFHIDRYMPTLQRQMNLDRLNQEIERYGLQVRVHMGNLIPIDKNIVQYIETGKAVSLNNSRYVLVELPVMDPPHHLNRMIYNLQINGFVPVIAHIEKCQYVQNDPDFVLTLKEKDVLLQMDYRSVSGGKNSPLCQCALELIERRWIDFVATGALDAFDYTPECIKEEKLLKSMVVPEYYDLIARINPQKVLEDEEIRPIKYQKKREKKGFFARLWGKG